VALALPLLYLLPFKMACDFPEVLSPPSVPSLFTPSSLFFHPSLFFPSSFNMIWSEKIFAFPDAFNAVGTLKFKTIAQR
jgi:hypothetical protein